MTLALRLSSLKFTFVGLDSQNFILHPTLSLLAAFHKVTLIKVALRLSPTKFSFAVEHLLKNLAVVMNANLVTLDLSSNYLTLYERTYEFYATFFPHLSLATPLSVNEISYVLGTI